MANVKVTTKKVVSNRESELKPEPRSSMPAPKISSRFESSGFVTTDPSVVEKLFENKIEANVKTGDYIEYHYPPELNDRIKALIKA